MIIARIVIVYMIINIAISMYVTIASGNSIDNMARLIAKDEEVQKEIASSKFVMVQVYVVLFLYSSFCVLPIGIGQWIKELSYKKAEKNISGDVEFSFTWDPQTATVTERIEVNGERVKYEDLNKAERKLYNSNAEKFVWDLEMGDSNKTKITINDIDRIKAQLRVD